MSKKKSETRPYSPLLSSLMVASAEATLCHPLGTGMKLDQTKEKKAPLFPGANTAFEKFKMTLRGIHLAGPNKVMGRVVTMGFQPLIKEKIDGRFSDVTAHVVAGVGPSIAATIMTLPLDTYKSKCQTGRPTRHIMTLLRDSQKAFLPTVTRNVIGMSSLFGGAAWVRQQMPGPQQGRAASPAEDLVACLAGGLSGAVFCNPADVIKTRTQLSGQSMMQVAREIGVFGMGRGLGLGVVKGVQRGIVYWLTRQAAGSSAPNTSSTPTIESGPKMR